MIRSLIVKVLLFLLRALDPEKYKRGVSGLTYEIIPEIKRVTKNVTILRACFVDYQNADEKAVETYLRYEIMKAMPIVIKKYQRERWRRIGGEFIPVEHIAELEVLVSEDIKEK